MNEINIRAKTLDRWEEILLPKEVKALHDLNHVDPWEVLTPGEILDIIVEWEGGLATGFQVRSLINRLYGMAI